MTQTTLKVLTLNCWDIPFGVVSKNRVARLHAIAKELGKGEYDIVLLQEIWNQADYKMLCERLVAVLPHSHYWHSGLIGSGVCVFSKYTVLETFQHSYAVNGYAHRIFHGDWYGGKCVGLAKIMVDDFRVNVYATHIHAAYADEDYQAHRVAQAYELSQFIRYTSEQCDAVIVGGDLNCKPEELGYKIIKFNANLEDSWMSQKQNKGYCSTSNAPDNIYTRSGSNEECIDYILYHTNTGNSIECEKCYCTMGKIPGSNEYYSDHEGVAAVLTLKRMVTVMSSMRDSGEIEKAFTEAIPVMDEGMKRVKANQVFYLVLFLMCAVLLAFISEVYLPYGLNIVLTVMKVCVVLLSGFCVWSGLVLTNIELNGLLFIKKDMNNLLKANPQK